MRILLVSEGKHEASGALEALVRRCAPVIESCVWERISRSDIHAHHGKGQGFFKRAVRWMWQARKEGYQALVLVADEDGHPERVREMDEAQEYSGVELPRALGVAIRTFDAWMLADEHALASVLDVPVPTQPSPEDSRDPKSSCADLLRGSDCGLSQRELYAEASHVLKLELLENRCPRGFGVFAARLKAL